VFTCVYIYYRQRQSNSHYKLFIVHSVNAIKIDNPAFIYSCFNPEFISTIRYKLNDLAVMESSPIQVTVKIRTLVRLKWLHNTTSLEIY